jgi:hypothetical protein
MTTSEIIDLFHLFTDDTTELSAAEELALANRVYQRVCSKPFEFLKTNVTGTIASGAITLPTDFLYLTENTQTTDMSVNQGQQVSKAVYVNGSPVSVVNFSDRVNSNGAYLDLANSKIVFTDTTTSGTYSFDYIKIPADLTLATSPVFPSKYHEVIAYGMAVDGFITQLFDKAKSYAPENQAKYNSILADLNMYNANLRCE